MEKKLCKIKIDALKSYKKYIILAAKLIGFYLIFYTLFRLYVGIIDPRGTIYSPFLHSFSLLQVVLDLLIYPTMFLLKIAGFETRHTIDTVGILGKNGVHIAYPCLGIELMIAFIALFYAFPGSKKFYFIIFGLIGIHCLNITRIFSIILLNKQLPNIVDLTHSLFNFFSYLLILSLFYVWYKKHSESKF